jgi:hypothetical protein
VRPAVTDNSLSIRARTALDGIDDSWIANASILGTPVRE